MVPYQKPLKIIGMNISETTKNKISRPMLHTTLEVLHNLWMDENLDIFQIDKILRKDYGVMVQHLEEIVAELGKTGLGILLVENPAPGMEVSTRRGGEPQSRTRHGHQAVNSPDAGSEPAKPFSLASDSEVSAVSKPRDAGMVPRRPT
jgi:hypothetical protein